MSKPIILGVEGESKRILEQANAGIAIRPEDADALVEAVLELSNEGLSKQKGINGKIFVREYFDRKKLAAEYLNVLQELAA